MSSHKMSGQGGRRRVILALAAALAGIAGVAVLVVFFVVQTEPPEPTSFGEVDPAPRTVGPEPSTPTGTTSAGDDKRHDDNDPLPASKPTSISIPAIDVKSPVIKIGKKPDGTLAAPDGKNIDKAAWYKNSPTPGQTGPSVIEGHIDTVEGRSVFYRLAALEEGDKVKVGRADGTRVVFTVTGLRSYPSDEAFPTNLVYGGDVSVPSLRLITCSNFDDNTGHYQGNTVVFATLTAVRGR